MSTTHTKVKIPQWYRENEIKEWLLRSEDIGMPPEIYAPFLTKHLQLAFEKGWNMSYDALTEQVKAMREALKAIAGPLSLARSCACARAARKAIAPPAGGEERC